MKKAAGVTYSYCLNNPLVYTDPSGDIFGAIFGFVSDLVDNLFIRTFKGEKWDWIQTKLGWRIDKGMFQTDSHKSTMGQVWEVVSRFTWQLPQTIVGDLTASLTNAIGFVNEVNYFHGSTVINTKFGKGGITFGSYIMGQGMLPDFRDHTFVHEYGHYLQSQKWGLFYLPAIGIPSLQSAAIDNDSKWWDIGDHSVRWFEAEASRNGANYVDKYYSDAGFNKAYFYQGWSYTGPIPYLNPKNMRKNQPHPEHGKFHWSDPLLYLYLLGLLLI